MTITARASSLLVAAIFLAPTQFTSFLLSAHLEASTNGDIEDTSQTPQVTGEMIKETGFYQSIALTSDSPLYSRQSKYQEILVHKSHYYGRILVLDGVVQLTEKDADSYNEMMAHIPMMEHKNPQKVLVIGGGDGYVLSEVLKHASVEHVDHVDLDGEVVETCKQLFPWGKAWEDPRVTLHITDGAAFVRNAPDKFYDVIVQDSSDPWTWDEDGNPVILPSNVLYSSNHFENISRILTTNGVLNLQAETFNIPTDLEGISKWRRQALDIGFTSAMYGSLMISSYPTGQIGFLLCKKNGNEDRFSNYNDVRRRFTAMEEQGMGTSYYHPRLQRSAFDLPLWVEKNIYGKSREHLLENLLPEQSDEL